MTVKHVWFLQKLINSNTGITSYGALGHVAWSLYIYTNLAISIYISPVGSGRLLVNTRHFPVPATGSQSLNPLMGTGNYSAHRII